MTYNAPIRDMAFALDHAVDMGRLTEIGVFDDLTPDLRDAILGELAKFADEVIAPLNSVSDSQGARLENGAVRTPDGFPDAYAKFVEGGWMSLAAEAEHGGQGLPHLLCAVVQEALHGACMAFGIGPTLTLGAIHALEAHGTEDQKRLYLPKLISGEWAATMNLTESHAGSDVGALRTKAEPVGDGTYKIKGQKIFITYGDQDLTDNIIHLVLARLSDAPAGTKGLSLFLIPKFKVKDDGTLGPRNDAKVVGIEHKMGLHGSPTCTMAYGDEGHCFGELVGEENRGMAAMFTMMNTARLDVGLQGVGIAERAYQQALGYAQERRQGKPFNTRHEPGGEMVAIIEHADVRRMLYTMKSQIEAARAICYANALAVDLAKHAPTEEERAKAKGREELLTPISKAWSTDMAIEVTSLGIQIHGGMGYVEETGAAQHFRDARISAIYEGANGIQAIDLVTRKLTLGGGASVDAFLAEIGANAAALKGSGQADLAVIGENLEAGLAALTHATQWMRDALTRDVADALAGATPYLRLFGIVTGGHFLGRGAVAAWELVGADKDVVYHDAKIRMARFFTENIVPQAAGLVGPATAGAQSLEAVNPEALSG